MSLDFDQNTTPAGCATLFLPLNRAWEFCRLPSNGSAAAAWTVVDLPHSPFVADLDGLDHWFGECEYRRIVALPHDAPADRITIFIGAGMHSATLFVDEREIGRHSGGYLPFEIDLTAALRDRQPHTLAIRLDNRDNPDVPPGKAYADLDFCWYGGLYRTAELRCYPEIHLTDPVAANEVAGGGVFVRTLAATEASATINVRTHIHNVGASEQSVQIGVELLQNDIVVAKSERNGPTLVPGRSATSADIELTIARPRLWQPEAPALYHARVTLSSAEGKTLDVRTVRFGIRRISFSRSGGFTINNRRLRLRGTNRHQDYPYVGYAVPPAAQRRDARRIKEAGFDYVRLSHYPQSPDFLDACDEFGIVVMNCIPGWQYMGNEQFRAACFQNARDLIRRDRNHPCVVLWELSLNETQMDEAFVSQMHRIGHEEYPGDQMYTCGWLDCFDVFTHSRQHGEIHLWRNRDKALVVAEYGDWEFYASNQGFDQKTGAGLFADWSHGRQLRASGERGLRQQASNHIVALNDTLNSPAVLNGQWSMFDYPRGYDPKRAACGIMDIFRLPKFSYYFYRSQRQPAEGSNRWHGGPMVFIASYWTAASDLRVLIFSNCDQVALRHNGTLLGKHKPSKAWMMQYLSHPPFVFEVPAFSPGTLEATGFIGGKAAAAHEVATPGASARLELDIDAMGVAAAAGEPDVLIAHACLVDTSGTLCVGDFSPVTFLAEGGAEIVGPTTIAAEAGVASVVLRVPADCTSFKLQATRSHAEGSFGASRTWVHPSLVESAKSESETRIPHAAIQ